MANKQWKYEERAVVDMENLVSILKGKDLISNGGEVEQ